MGWKLGRDQGSTALTPPGLDPLCIDSVYYHVIELLKNGVKSCDLHVTNLMVGLYLLKMKFGGNQPEGGEINLDSRLVNFSVYLQLETYD